LTESQVSIHLWTDHWNTEQW